jgi:hypothetical protein
MVSYDNVTVQVGSRVRLEDQDGEEEFYVVSSAEADPVQRRISMDSPLGSSTWARPVGATLASPFGQAAPTRGRGKPRPYNFHDRRGRRSCVPQ